MTENEVPEKGTYDELAQASTEQTAPVAWKGKVHQVRFKPYGFLAYTQLLQQHSRRGKNDRSGFMAALLKATILEVDGHPPGAPFWATCAPGFGLKLMNLVEDEEPAEKGPKEVTCPSCAAVFEVDDQDEQEDEESKN